MKFLFDFHQCMRSLALLCGFFLSACSGDPEQQTDSQNLSENQVQISSNLSAGPELNPAKLERFLRDLYDLPIQPWNQSKINVDSAEKRSILLALGRDDFYNQQVDSSYYQDHFHFFDLNKDGSPEIIYNGADGADSELVMIWMKENEKWALKYHSTGVILLRDSAGFWIFNPHLPGMYMTELSHIGISRDSVFLDENWMLHYKTLIPENPFWMDSINVIHPVFTSAGPGFQDCDEFLSGRVCQDSIFRIKNGQSGQILAEFNDSLLVLIDDTKSKVLGWISRKAVIHV